MTLPEGVHVVKTDYFINGRRQHYLAFDLGRLPAPRNSDCVPRWRGESDTCLVYFHKEPADPPYPKMVGWGATSSTNIVQNPTTEVIAKLLIEENDYREERDKYIKKFKSESTRGKTMNVIKNNEGLTILNREINSLYEEYFPDEVSVAEQSKAEIPDDEEIYISQVAVPPGPRLFSGLLDATSSKKTRKLRRDINKLRRAIARNRRIGYRYPLTDVDKWNESKDREGLSDTSSDDEEVDMSRVQQQQPSSHVMWGDYTSDEDGSGYKRRKRKKKRKKKTKKHKKSRRSKKSRRTKK